VCETVIVENKLKAAAPSSDADAEAVSPKNKMRQQIVKKH
jgi:hypothetical protein